MLRVAIGGLVVARFDEDSHRPTLAIWGLAFKPNTHDKREALSLLLIREMLQLGAVHSVHDLTAIAAAQRAHAGADAPANHL